MAKKLKFRDFFKASKLIRSDPELENRFDENRDGFLDHSELEKGAVILGRELGPQPENEPESSPVREAQFGPKKEYGGLLALLPGYRSTPVVLVLVNLIPLVCVLFFGWKVFFLVALYWAENVIVGVVNVVKMVSVLFVKPAFFEIGKIIFFIIHYGGFTFAHGLILFSLFGPQNKSPGKLELFDSIQGLLAQPLLWVAGVGLFIHHFISYLINFLGTGEYLEKTVQNLLFEPYGRVVVLHLAIIFGGFWVHRTGEPVWALVLLVALKTSLEFGAHMVSHAPIKARA